MFAFAHRRAFQRLSNGDTVLAEESGACLPHIARLLHLETLRADLYHRARAKRAVAIL